MRARHLNRFLTLSLTLLTLLCLPFMQASAGTGSWTRHSDGSYYATDGVTEGVTARGIDVSTHQGTIDWDTLYREEYLTGDLDFVILRCGYGSDYTSQDDAQFHRNAQACTRLGIPFGVYLYSYANTEAKARSEAAHTLRLLEGYELTYPVYYDLEDKIMASMGSDFLTRIAYIFCDTLKAAGYEVGVYSMRNWFDNGNLASIDYEGKGYSKWIAQFSGNYLRYSGTYDIWQCTSSGSVAGIAGRCDINFSFMPRRTVNHSRITLDPNTSDRVTGLIAPFYIKNEHAYGKLPTLTREGYVFEGWYTAAQGGDKITSTSLVNTIKEQTLYAHWSKVTQPPTTTTTTAATTTTTTTTTITTTTTTTTTTISSTTTTSAAATTTTTTTKVTSGTTTVAMGVTTGLSKPTTTTTSTTAPDTTSSGTTSSVSVTPETTTSPATTPDVPADGTQAPDQESSPWAVVGLVGGGVLLSGIILLGLLWWRRRSHKTEE